MKKYLTLPLLAGFLATTVSLHAAPPTYRIFGTREGLVGGTTANGHVIVTRDHFCALPSSTVLNVSGGRTYTVTIKNTANGKIAANVPVWDVGPWNLHDNYWHSPRAIWPTLTRGLPGAQAAYENGFNGGKDEKGRTVANPAGIDLADGTFWDDLGLSNNGWVEVTYNWEDPGSAPAKLRGKVFKADFDGDGKADFATWRPSNGQWSVAKSSTSASWYVTWGSGAAGDIPVPADYDGDGKADFAVWRPSSGDWAVIKSSNGASSHFTWGQANDIPVPADYDGDGKVDYAIFRPSSGGWSVAKSSTGATLNFTWGQSGDTPVPGDYDGDRKIDFAIWRPSNGGWIIAKSSNGATWTQFWGSGAAGDIPLSGDYDGDGKLDFAVWRPSSGDWAIIKSSTGAGSHFAWGASTDIPSPSDFDYDGKCDLVAWRPSSGDWAVVKSSTGASLHFGWGQSGDIPLP